MSKPSNFIKFPWSSVVGKNECETVALNIMIILARTGDTFRPLSWQEYEQERLIDGNFSQAEGRYFDVVSKFCLSAEAARGFSLAWREKEEPANL